MAKQTKTNELSKLIEAAKAASSEHREAQAEAEAAQDQVARCRDAASEAHAAGGDVAGALEAYHAAERSFDEARIKIDGFARKSDRARGAVDEHMQAHHLDLIEDLKPEADKVMAEIPEVIARLVELEAQRTDIHQGAARYVTAGGVNSQGNMPTPDVLPEVTAVLRDVLSGVRPLASPLPHWNHHDAMEQHWRNQAEAAERREQDKRDRAGVGT